MAELFFGDASLLKERKDRLQAGAKERGTATLKPTSTCGEMGHVQVT